MEIHVTIERVTIRLVGEMNMDIFDRIAAGVAALAAGNSTALAAHVAEIDTHLSNVDGEVLGLQGDDTSGKARLDAIEAGLGKVADAINPPAATGGTTGGTSTPPASSGGTTSTPPADGSQSPDQTPGGTPAPTAHASAPIPSSGVGSETTGQVDTPVTQ